MVTNYEEAEGNWKGISSANQSSHIVTNCQKPLRELTASRIGLIDVQSGADIYSRPNDIPNSNSIFRLVDDVLRLNSPAGRSSRPEQKLEYIRYSV